MSSETLHFGYNCIHFRKKDKRCEVAITRLNDPKYDWLHEEKWVAVKKAADVLEVTTETVRQQIKDGELKSRRKPDGKDEVCIDQAQSYEVCPLSDAGGQCLDFKPTKGEHINCLADLSKKRPPQATLLDG